jgi:hypothetical protein
MRDSIAVLTSFVDEHTMPHKYLRFCDSIVLASALDEQL